MRDARFEEPLSDAALDREIERLLDVEPSAHFVHRVRAHVAAAESLAEARRWRPLWIAAAAATAAALVAVSLTMFRSGQAPAAAVISVDAGLPHAAVQGRDRGLTPAPAAGQVPPQPIAASGHSRTAGVRDATAAGTPASEPPLFMPVTSEELRLPPVLIAADERRALEWLLVGRPGPEPARREADASAAVPDLGPLAEIEVPELEIAPLAQIATLEGGRP